MKNFTPRQARDATNAVFKAILDRDADPPALQHYTGLLTQNEVSVRELVRRLAGSDEFVTKSILPLPPSETAHGLFRRFLGRPAASDREARDLAVRIIAQGWRSQIDWFLNSGEYLKKFGDDETPFTR